MNEILSALLLGFSFGNLWLCVLLVFSLQTTNRATCGGYLLGRVVAILGLSLVAALAGKLVPLEKPVLNLVSGALLAGFAAYLAATRLGSWVPPWRQPRPALAHAAAGPAHASGAARSEMRAELPRAKNTSCDGHCQSCPTRTVHMYAKACQECGDSKLCAAEEPAVEPLTRDARRLWQRRVPEAQSRGFAFGIGVGALRGAALCGKLAVLLPLLAQASAPKAIGIGLAFSLSSSIYPLLGIFFAKLALRFLRFKRLLFVTSCAFLAVAGLMYLRAGLHGLFIGH
jgi:hypothetical protein